MQIARAVALAGHAASRQAALPKDAQLGDALQHNPPPAPCYMAPNPLSPGSLLYVLYISQSNPLNIHSPRVPCYMCYMCYISQGDPLNIHSPRVPRYMYYMCYMGLTRQPTEHPLSPGSMQYVLYVLYGPYIAHIVQIFARKYIAHIAHIARNPGRVDVQWDKTHIAHSKEQWMFSALPCKTHIAHIAHIARNPRRVDVQWIAS